MVVFRLLITFVLFLLSLPAFAWTDGGWEIHDLYRGARATGMGNAFTAVADDEEAIFYNPAGLAGVKNPTFHVLPIDIEGSTDLMTNSSSLSKFKSFSPASLNALMGTNVYGRATLTPSLVFPNFGISVIVDGQAEYLSKNEALPWVLVGYQNTNGYQAAFGFSVLGKKKGRADLRVGGAAKMLWRRGGYHLMSLKDLLNADQNMLGDMTGSYGKGYGGDLGAQFVYEFPKRWKLMAGLSWTDIGDTAFDSAADPIKSNLSAGIAATYEPNPLFHSTFSYDLRNLQMSGDMRKKNHVGLECAFPVFSVFGGINQIYLTYGGSVNLGLIKLTLVSYAEELGYQAGMEPDRRYMLRIDLKFGL